MHHRALAHGHAFSRNETAADGILSQPCGANPCRHSAVGVGAVVITGAETDVCVLSTVLSAVDLGFRVVIVEDALCSSSDVRHDALMTMYRTRFHGQVDLVTAEELVAFWRE
jgi:nicotinamidase-related amidase